VLRVDVRSEVHRLLLDLGITAVFVTHDQEEAFIVGDRVAVMRNGVIVQVDSPQAVYANPTDRWTAEFVGTTSIITGQASAGTVLAPFGSVPVAADLTGPVDVVLRPEQLAITDGDAATVEDVEFFGHDTMVHLKAGGNALRVRAGADATLTRGARVGVVFVGDTARAFPVS
jgi:ABC-type Fe3+/spermidine/putrescine transport system ATPase subunit